MKHLTNKPLSEKFPFMGDEVEIRKLTVREVRQVQELVTANLKSKKGKTDEESGLALMRGILRIAVIGADEMTDEDFDSFPLVELNELSSQVLRISGIGDQGASEGN
jgi:hypothetical protein